MRPQEFFLLWDAKRPRDAEQDYAGTLNEDACESLYAKLMEDS